MDRQRLVTFSITAHSNLTSENLEKALKLTPHKQNYSKAV
jgi:hypothetical protein